jgi:peroxiredoxin
MSIKVGERLPNVTVRQVTPDGPKPVETKDYFAGKTVVLFGLPAPSRRPATRTTCRGSSSARRRSRRKESTRSP